MSVGVEAGGVGATARVGTGVGVAAGAADTERGDAVAVASGLARVAGTFGPTAVGEGGAMVAGGAGAAQATSRKDAAKRKR